MIVTKKLNVGIVVFPGSNCDQDCFYVFDEILKQNVKYIWHKESILGKVDLIVLPGGFSYGDYLRCGAIARFSPVMRSVVEFAESGGYVLGICNGFQILCEAGLLPGALLKNKSLTFICDTVNLRVENNKTFFTSEYNQSEIIRIPIAHGEGRYFADEKTINELEANSQVVLRYCSPDGRVDDDFNPNGSLNNIAGIINERGNVFGLMPHPERASDTILRNVDGRKIFESIIKNFIFR
ncbi:MAG: Phosphoribosylformylglycinamidine synthase, glutamine amidotransferase subunit [Ignavibacteriae bacterium]|nr:MAG: Phosphoribosylformylglycinamidine synthase, glutamine amidotransferase subunit [Ignavibacteriota bacterium]